MDALGVASGLGAQPYWASVQGLSTPTGSPWQVTYLTKARQGPLLRVQSLPLHSLEELPCLAKAKQVTEMSSTGYYIPLELYFMTVCTFVSMPPHHIFLHAM